MRDLTRCIAAGFYRMGVGIGTGKTPVELRARIGKTDAFLPFASPLSVFAHHSGLGRKTNLGHNALKPSVTTFTRKSRVGI
jgi:hypothetical protein